MIPREKWKWQGSAAHFVAAASCRWHLCTVVGDYVVSSVGEYVPYVPRGKEAFEKIGCDRLYETFVFHGGGACADSGCTCGGEVRVHDFSEIDSLGANTRAEAAANHEALCLKWAAS